MTVPKIRETSAVYTHVERQGTRACNNNMRTHNKRGRKGLRMKLAQDMYENKTAHNVLFRHEIWYTSFQDLHR